MFNIVIAVVNETFEKVSMKKREAEYLTKAELLYDFAMFTKLNCWWDSEPNDDELKHMYIMRWKKQTTHDWTCSVD